VPYSGFSVPNGFEVYANRATLASTRQRGAGRWRDPLRVRCWRGSASQSRSHQPHLELPSRSDAKYHENIAAGGKPAQTPPIALMVFYGRRPAFARKFGGFPLIAAGGCSRGTKSLP